MQFLILAASGWVFFLALSQYLEYFGMALVALPFNKLLCCDLLTVYSKPDKLELNHQPAQEIVREDLQDLGANQVPIANLPIGTLQPRSAPKKPKRAPMKALRVWLSEFRAQSFLQIWLHPNLHLHSLHSRLPRRHLGCLCQNANGECLGSPSRALDFWMRKL